MSIVTYLTPTNLDKEKERFLSSSRYNPVFRYDWTAPAQRHWAASAEREKKVLAAIHAQAYTQIVKAASEVFQSPLDLPALGVAHHYLEQQPQLEPPVPVAQVAERFTKAFLDLGLHEYTVEVTDQLGFNFRPQVGNHKLIMSSAADLSFLTLTGEIKHELTHIIRAENGRFNSIPRSAEYLPTEEGLASYYQDYGADNRQSSLFQHAAEYGVTQVLLQGTMRDGFEYFCSLGFPAELAWQRVSRHKFGWIDTSQPGDIMKPSMYFYHEQQIRALTDAERYRLLVGKITPSDLVKYPDYVGRVPLAQLQELFST